VTAVTARGARLAVLLAAAHNASACKGARRVDFMKAWDPQAEESTTASDAVIQFLRAVALAALTAVAMYLCWKLLSPFIYAFTWAFALAVACAPLRKWLISRTPPLAAAVFMVAITITVIAVPVTFILRQLLQESLKAQSLLVSSLQANGWRSTISANRWLGPLWNWADQQLDLRQIAQQAAAEISTWIAPAVARSLRVVSQTGAMLLALFFFLRDQEAILAGMARMLPLSPDETDRLFTRVSTTLRTAVYGRVFIGFLQGSLGGLIFAVVGLPAAVFWGAIMSLLSILPFLGSFVVWIPACGFLLLSGRWVAALIVAIWGVAVINPVDNILYPALVGARLGIHPLILFLAFVGGLIAFGPTGLILGPCIIAVAAGLSEVWHGREATASHGGDA
jgi:predicted PurR-regulated permease PerM